MVLRGELSPVSHRFGCMEKFGFNAVIYLAAHGISPNSMRQRQLTAAVVGKRYGISLFQVLQVRSLY